MPEAINTDHHLVVVATGIDRSTEQIIEYIRGYRVPINVLFFEYLEDTGRRYLARTWLTDPDAAAPPAPSVKKQTPWNGADFFCAVGGNPTWRAWEDMRTYGFVSAGHGPKYRNAIARLTVGAKVWAEIPKTGYVGVGEVTAEAVRVSDFAVQLNGSPVPVLEAPLEASHMGDEMEDPERCEYVVAVRWIETRPRSEAVWERGMYANPNVVTPLRHPFTLQRLSMAFGLDEN